MSESFWFAWPQEDSCQAVSCRRCLSQHYAMILYSAVSFVTFVYCARKKKYHTGLAYASVSFYKTLHALPYSGFVSVGVVCKTEYAISDN